MRGKQLLKLIYKSQQSYRSIMFRSYFLANLFSFPSSSCVLRNCGCEAAERVKYGWGSDPIEKWASSVVRSQLVQLPPEYLGFVFSLHLPFSGSPSPALSLAIPPVFRLYPTGVRFPSTSDLSGTSSIAINVLLIWPDHDLQLPFSSAKTSFHSRWSDLDLLGFIYPPNSPQFSAPSKVFHLLLEPHLLKFGYSSCFFVIYQIRQQIFPSLLLRGH